MKAHHILFVISILFTTNYLTAQLDYVHWLPPMHSRDDGQITDHYLYLSTPSPDPFVVTLTDGSGTVLATPTISEGMPFIYNIAPDDPSEVMIRDNDLNTVLTDKGIIASADERFYCNFRARSLYHATSVTCKGTAARGQIFRVGAMPQQFEHAWRNFTIGIMATEDNTTVTISDYDIGVEFFDNAGNITDDMLNFVLDSGESYVITGYNDIIANLDGFVGALVEADKPIVMNNGNWCGSMADAGGQDIGMDQSVPVNILGYEYILIRGDGDDQMERPLVVAHSNGTNIYVNDWPDPIATINAGEYFLVPELHYTGAGHENMYIRTTQPAYVYQPLGGSPSRATPGLNFIPPISCSLTREINAIPSIDQIGGTLYNGAIILFTLAGATVTVNGLPQAGGEPVNGAPAWETYKIVGFTGDVDIKSTDRMAAGMFGFSGDAGFAGFYSGFDQIGFVDFSFIENCEVEPVEFTDETITFAEEIISWHWDMGDGTVLTDSDPIHTYDEGGTYTVFLEVVTNMGCTDTVSYPVEVRHSPTADFTFEHICMEEEIEFDEASFFDEGIITAWDWDFGDTDSSDEVSPTHLYDAYGTYTVSLDVTADNGCISNLTDTAFVFPLPTTDFTAIDGCFYDSTLFTNTSTIPLGWITGNTWDFGDGSDPSTLESPTHLYASHGTYDVSLSTISDRGCTTDTTLTIIRFAAPEVDLGATNNCVYDSIITENLTTIADPYVIDTYTWDFGDGASSTEITPEHLYTEHGTYDIMLIALSEEGCVDTGFYAVTIYDQPVANFAVEDNCIYEPAFFDNLSEVADGDLTTFDWTYGDGGTSGLESPTHGYSEPGIYTVSLEVVSEHGCIADTTLITERFAVPDVEFTSANVCLYDSVLFDNSSTIVDPYVIAGYTWEFGDSYTGSADSPAHLYSAAGTFNITLTAISEHGCESEITQPITVHPMPEASFEASTVCLNEGPTFFENTSYIESGVIFTWEWTFPDASTSGAETPSYHFETSGEFPVQLIVTSALGCSDTVITDVIVRPLPFVEFELDNPVICGNECITATSYSFAPESEISSLKWYTDFGHELYGEVVELCFESYSDSTAFYDLTLVATDEFGCSDTNYTADLIKVLPTPLASFTTYPDESDIINPEVQFTNTSLYATHYSWDFGDGSPYSYDTHPTHIYDDSEPGTYEIILYAFSDTEKECVDTARKVIKVLDQVIYYVPNAFTPDGDEYNNFFTPIFTVGHDPYNYHLSIFNRWGEILFESYNAEIGWDGTNADFGLVQDGVYIWKIEFKERSSGKTVQDMGHVTLLR